MGTTSDSLGNLKLGVAAEPHIRANSIERTHRRQKLSSRCQRGLWVVLLGPDGVGKSSVIQAMGDGVAAGFTRCKAYHLRPSLIRPQNAAQTNSMPHAQPARSRTMTYAKLAYLLALNWLTYWLRVRPQIIQGSLVIFDRYFTDLTVDPRRYRVPDNTQRAVSLVRRLMPQPDLHVVLDAPVDVLHKRKREVAALEAECLRSRYRTMAEQSTSTVLVDAARPLPYVVDDVVERIIERHLVRESERFEAA